MTHMPVSGWYTDPFDVSGLRYWSGERWTTETRRSSGVASAPPLESELAVAVPPPGAPVPDHMSAPPPTSHSEKKGIGAGGIIGILITVGVVIIAVIVVFAVLQNSSDDGGLDIKPSNIELPAGGGGDSSPAPSN
ncbi:DUF2510 domain-containing protein [Demequina aurantiaca]|uniref:DUF2510 domain-containing protein n=1 Tax=Demequina aurantiaca TaxID=676200 RepID=UPI0007833D7C|nr:DUF2510 domain-containing protein [Demequina aurantiaca]